MIRRLQIHNFKSIRNDMSYIDFAPITLFAGANSSGKSSVIQSILLIMQTFPTRQNPTLLLNGELVTLGTVVEVWNSFALAEDNVTEPLSIEIEIDDPKNTHQILGMTLVFLPATNTTVYLNRAEYRVTRYPESEVNHEFITPDVDRIAIEYVDEDYRIAEITDDLRKHIKQELEKQGLQDIGELNHARVYMEGLFPRTFDIIAKVPTSAINWDVALVTPRDERILEKADFSQKIPQQELRLLRKIVEQQRLPGFTEKTWLRKPVVIVKTFGDYHAWFNSLPVQQAGDFVEALSPELGNLLVDERITHSIPLLDQIEDSFMRLALQNIRYLGAFRIEPTIIFSPDVTSQWSEVGINGANVAAALKEHGNKEIDWYHPDEYRLQHSTLFDALVTWLQHFGLLDNVTTREEGKLGTMLKIRSAGVRHDMDLTSVGFGTSQLLPIIVQGLLTRPGGIFIVEQPEVHLHPHIQSQLAIFFIALSKANVQCIIETHSENIVNQLRLFVAYGNQDIRQKIKMYFADRHIEYGTAFEEVEIDEGGNIINWPRGFMDESNRQARAMLKALIAEEG